jgi:hypothetical protein
MLSIGLYFRLATRPGNAVGNKLQFSSLLGASLAIGEIMVVKPLSQASHRTRDTRALGGRLTLPEKHADVDLPTPEPLRLLNAAI